jgi:hypothetical protein
MAQRMNGSTGDARSFRVGLEEVLHHPILERPFPSGKEIGARIVADPQVRPQGFCCVAPEGLLAANAVLVVGASNMFSRHAMA